jgi:hypothetical protein
MLQSLDVGVPVFSPEGSTITGIHLVLQDFDHIQDTFSEDELIEIYSILVDLSVSPEYRRDHLRFTFEIRYS